MKYLKTVFIFFLFVNILFQSTLAIPKRIKGVIAADCHGMIVQSKKWKRERKITLFVLRHLNDLPFIATIAFKIWYKYWHLNHERISISGVLQKFPELAKYCEELYDIRRLENPISSMIALLRKLKEVGCLLVLASNLDPDIFEYNSKQCPELLDLFDFHFLSILKKNTPILEYRPKPDAEYFVDLRKTISKYVSDEVEIIFIDDRQENIEAATKSNCNIRGVSPYEFAIEFEKNI